ncbi:Transposase IS66 family protein [anaerobic digester metagenome]
MLVQAKEIKETYHDDGVPIPPVILNSLKVSYDELIQAGLNENPPPIIKIVKRGRKKLGFVRNLLERLHNWKEGVLRFIDNPIVPFDNNLAERDIRMMKVKMKISGGFRDFDTGRAVSRIRSYISTIRKNEINVIEGIKLAIDKKPWMPNQNLKWIFTIPHEECSVCA